MTAVSGSLRERPAWKALETHQREIAGSHLRDLFASDPGRAERFAVEAAGLYLDYSKNRITDETLRLLLQLADESGLRERIDAMFRGEHINVSEDRAVLHVALRMPEGDVAGRRRRGRRARRCTRCSAACARSPSACASGEWKGHTGKPIRNVVNIGIGGSDLGR